MTCSKKQSSDDTKAEINIKYFKLTFIGVL